MATTAILSALAEEQAGLLERLEHPESVRRAGREFWRGRLHGQAVVLALSRIGKVAAATTATALIESFAVDRIVFTGVAGALGDRVQVGDLVVATGFLQHDMDASPLFPRFEVPLYGQAQFACDAALSGLLFDAGRMALTEHTHRMRVRPSTADGTVHQGLIVSGDCFIATARASTGLKSAMHAAGLDPMAVEMEGAAVAQVCHDYGVPFAAVRTISDRADDSAHTDFGHFVTHVASHYALGIVDHLMRALAARGQRPA